MKNIIFLISLLLLSGCKKGNILVDTLNSLNGFNIEKYEYEILQNDLISNLNISGTCNENVTDIEISFNNGELYQTIEPFVESKIINCQNNKTFQLQLKNPNTINKLFNKIYAFTESLYSQNILLRGKSEYGPTTNDYFQIKLHIKKNLIEVKNINMTNSNQNLNFKGSILSTSKIESENNSKIKFRGTISFSSNTQ